jgi:hypothetical protein
MYVDKFKLHEWRDFVLVITIASLPGWKERHSRRTTFGWEADYELILDMFVLWCV